MFILLLLSACSGPKPHVADKPSSQRFRNVTRFLPPENLFVTQAGFLRGNQDALSDLVVLNQIKNELYILLNRGKGFFKKNVGKWIQENKERINFFVSADLDRDGGDDLILILGDRRNLKTRILFNNKKGYFYPKKNRGNHSLYSGIEKVIPIDIDGDGDKDLFYFGSNIKKSNKNSYQTMIWINKGDGRLENLTALLMPKLPTGIRAVSYTHLTLPTKRIV